MHGSVFVLCETEPVVTAHNMLLCQACRGAGAQQPASSQQHVVWLAPIATVYLALSFEEVGGTHVAATGVVVLGCLEGAP